MTRLAAWRGVFAALLLFVTFMTLTPNPDDTEGEMSIARFIAELLFGSAAFGDKVAHVAAYAALGAAAMFASIRIFGRRLFTLAALIAYGVLLEGLQGLGGVRSADALDALANASGAFAGVAAHHAALLALSLRRCA